MAADVTGADEFGSYFKPTHYIGWANDLGSSDFTSTMSLVITGLLEDSNYAFFTFNTLESFFGFDFDGDVVYRSGPFCKAYHLPDMMLLAECMMHLLLLSLKYAYTCQNTYSLRLSMVS